jgi:tRNA (cmo5U34)-methyltransferase
MYGRTTINEAVAIDASPFVHCDGLHNVFLLLRRVSIMGLSAREWSSPQNAVAYLNVADNLPHRSEGESVLIDHLPENTKRVLDLGTGDGRLIRLIKENRPDIEAVALDVSPTMLKSARDHFANDTRVKITEHDLSQPLPDLGYFDAVVSSFAIHHLKHERKRELYQEIYDIINTTGVFCNLEHVASPSVELHVRFLNAIGYTPEKEGLCKKDFT